MPPIVLVLLQGLFLLLLYFFVARVARAVLRDTSPPRAPARQTARRPAPRQAAAPTARKSSSRARPRELVVHMADGRPQILQLGDDEIRFGRDAESTVVLNDPYVSDRHARVYRSDEGWVVADSGSTNGTFLNQAKVTSPAPLHPGDQLGIGKTVVEVRK